MVRGVGCGDVRFRDRILYGFEMSDKGLRIKNLNPKP